MPSKDLEDYITINDPELKEKYHGNSKIPMQYSSRIEQSLWSHLEASYVNLYPGSFATKHPLHLTSNPHSTPSSPSSSPSPGCTPLTSLADSEAPESGPAHSQNQSFTTGLAMLLYNVCYLAQGVDILMSQAGDALSNLWAVCCSGELGQSFKPLPLVLLEQHEYSRDVQHKNLASAE
ncbi:hypothetical protein BD769DRAFT_1388838 [Suillus cothurnatus]|nr:hypothetical protein BD769DRAFT_1388838 [Suillus cothurnatus]